MKISAKGMFRKLGYIQEDVIVERFIAYKKRHRVGFNYIEFDTIDKTYEASYYDSKGKSHPLIITHKELVAIYEQIEELGGGFNGKNTNRNQRMETQSKI